MNENHQSVFENLPVAVLILDIHGRILMLNTHGLELLYYSQGEVENQLLTDFIGINDRSRFQDWFVSVVSHQSFPALDICFRRKDGELLPFRLNGKLSAETPDDVRVNCVCFDLSQQLGFETIIKTGELSMKGLLDSTPDAMVVVNSKGNIVYVNHQITRYFGYSSEELTGLTIEKLIPERFRGNHFHLRENFFKEPKPRQMGVGMELFAQKKDGDEFPVEISLNYQQVGNDIFVLAAIRDISERKKMGESLRESQERFSSAFEFAAIGMALVSLDGTWIKVNQSVCRLFGYSEEELVQMKFQDITYPEDLDKDLLNVQKMLRGEIQNYRIEKRYFHKNRRVIWTHLNVSLVRSSDQQPLYFISQIEDITEIKMTEQALRQSEERFRLAAAGTGLGIWEWNRKHEHDYISAKFCELLGFGNDELEADLSKIIRMIHPDHIKLVKSELLNHLTRKQVFKIEFRMKKKGGAYAWFSATGQAEFDENGYPVRMVGYLIDIAKRKEAEEALHLSEERFRELYENSTFGIYRTSRAGKIILANPALIRLLGYASLEEVQNIDLNVDGYGSGNTREEFIRRIEETGKISDEESVWLKKDGTPVFVRESAKLIIDKNTGEHFYDGTVEDITEKKQAEKDRIAREAAEEANRAKSIFLANMSHEIRTPLNSIIGFSDLLYSSMHDPKARSQAESIRVSGRNLLRIINDILDLSKIEAGKLVLRPEPVDIHKFLGEFEPMFFPISKEKGISFFIEIETRINYTLLIDETRVRQILYNLIGNAIKFTEDGYVILLVNCMTKSSGKLDLIFTVEDTGIGIPEDQQEIIFEPFTQQEGQLEKKYGGTGLGLSITQRVVEMMGGTIQVTSTLGRGSTFRVVLPDIAIAGEITDVQENSVPDLSVCRFKPARILVVDDNDENRKLLKDYLEYFPLEIAEASNGQQAIDQAAVVRPQLILMDLRMPGINGVEATQIIKSRAETKDIPVIACSASSKIVFREQLQSEIFDGFVLKPIVWQELADELKRFLPYDSEAETLAGESGQDSWLALNPEQMEKLPDLIRILDNEFVPVCQEVLKRQVINQIERFGQELVSLGRATDFDVLVVFGEGVCMYADNFEIDKLMEKLKNFPTLVSDLKRVSKKNKE
ncbi:MAG: PAS domain S-box protein [Prolixibacteraceae bacterium]|nr:PAS domain S-box protein [Prolixibacteraceae bacterium]